MLTGAAYLTNQELYTKSGMQYGHVSGQRHTNQDTGPFMLRVGFSYREIWAYTFGANM